MALPARARIPSFVFVTLILTLSVAGLFGYFLVTLRSLNIYLATAEVMHLIGDELSIYQLRLNEELAHHDRDPLIRLEARLETADRAIGVLLDGGALEGTVLIRVHHPVVRSHLHLLRHQVGIYADTADLMRAPWVQRLDLGWMPASLHRQFVEMRATLTLVGTILDDGRRADQRALVAALIALIVMTCGLTVYVAAILWARRQDSRRFVAQLRKEIEEKEAAVRAAGQAGAAKSAFLAVMSHELRTPLNAIIGFSEMILAEVHGPIAKRSYRDYVGHVHESGLRLLDLVTMVLDYSRADAGLLDLRHEEIDVDLLASRRVEEMAPAARRKTLDMRFDRPAHLPRLACDPNLVGSAVLNTLSNAVKFTPDGGRIRVSVLADDRGLSLSISDDGIGMSPDEVQVAMAPFGQVDSTFSRQHQGAGLGLPFSRLVMRAHGGDLAVDSVPGRGTTVRLNFPPDRLRPCRCARAAEASDHRILASRGALGIGACGSSPPPDRRAGRGKSGLNRDHGLQPTATG